MPFDGAASLLATLLPVAVGRGEDPDGGSGVLIIVLSIVGAILVVGAVVTLVARKTRG